MVRGLQWPHLVYSKGAQDVLGSRPDYVQQRGVLLLTMGIQGTQGTHCYQTLCRLEHLLQALLTCLPQGGQKAGRARAPDVRREGKGAGLLHTWSLALLTGVHCPQMQQMYDMIMQHKRAMQDMQLLWEKALQQHQHGYDSDEEVDSELGTWEHQLRRMEMDKTRGAPRGPRCGWGVGQGTWVGPCPQEAPLTCPGRYLETPPGVLSRLCNLYGLEQGTRLLCLRFLSGKK